MSDLWDSLGATEGTTRHASIGGFQIKPHDHWSRLGRVQAMLRTASDPYDGGKTITRAQYDSMVPHEYAGTGTPLHPDEDGYWAMYLGDGGTTLVTGLELVEADYPLSADLPSHQGGKDDTVDWDARKMRSEPSDPEGQPAEQNEKEPVKWLESSKTAATYEVRPVIERGGEWQPAGEELAEAEEVMKGLYDRTGDFHLVLLRNNFNGGVYVYQVDSPIFNARPFPMGTYEDFYGAPFHDSRTAAVGSARTAANGEGLANAAQVVAQHFGGEGSTISAPAKMTIWLGDGGYDGTFITVTTRYGEVYRVEDISGKVDLDKIENHRPDPDNPGKWIWDKVNHPKGTYKVWSQYEALFYLSDLGGGRWQKDADYNGEVITLNAARKTANPSDPKNAPWNSPDRPYLDADGRSTDFMQTPEFIPDPDEWDGPDDAGTYGFKGWKPEPTTAAKTAMPAPADLGVAVGDIFVNSWGYDQTNVNFYKVIRLTGQGVEIVPIGKKFVSQNGPGGDSVMPDPDNVLDRDVCTGIGISWDDGADKKSKVCKLRDGGRGLPTIVLRSGQYWASKWDGQPEHQTDSMFGH